MKPLGNTSLFPGRTDATYKVPLNSLQRWAASREITGLTNSRALFMNPGKN
jgi:hypothetical protein